MPRGDHRFPFEFQLPESNLPCSFESKIGIIRYYLRVIIDIPYASPPQGLKYFTIIGPHIDCMEDRYLVSFLKIISFCGVIVVSGIKHYSYKTELGTLLTLGGVACVDDLCLCVVGPSISH